MTGSSPARSDKLGPLRPKVAAFVKDYSRLFEESSSNPLPPGRSFSLSEKKAVERELAAIIDGISAEGKIIPDPERDLDRDRLETLAARLRPLFKNILGSADLPLDSIYDQRFVESTRDFLRAARNFDPEIGIDSVYQALRNVWIMNTLQFELGLEVKHTDAVFGYSMVYPYLDNFLDNEQIAESDKLASIVKLRAWLEGEDPEPGNPLEEKLRKLVGLVEGIHSRSSCPGVYQSMLSIYNAQVKSLLQQRKPPPARPVDVLGISFEKGGTSVLADGYLVAGRLEPEQEDFCFGFGTFLQLADDLQDINEDLRRGHVTLFTQAAGRRHLDPLVYRFVNFMRAVLERTGGIDDGRGRSLREVIRRGCSLMAMESVGKHPEFFSRPCVRLCQESFPVRYSVLKKIRKRLESKVLSGRTRISEIDPALAAFLTVSSRAFALD